jgi:hypothetical protein
LNEWLKLMLEEIRRKQREHEEAAREHQRRLPGAGAESPGGKGGARPPGAGGRD